MRQNNGRFTLEVRLSIVETLSMIHQCACSYGTKPRVMDYKRRDGMEVVHRDNGKTMSAAGKDSLKI